jgi:hypothetical protein
MAARVQAAKPGVVAQVSNPNPTLNPVRWEKCARERSELALFDSTWVRIAPSFPERFPTVWHRGRFPV